LALDENKLVPEMILQFPHNDPDAN
jgi:hypothetical protein